MFSCAFGPRSALCCHLKQKQANKRQRLDKDLQIGTEKPTELPLQANENVSRDPFAKWSTNVNADPTYVISSGPASAGKSEQ